jgi:hypothetical protein
MDRPSSSDARPSEPEAATRKPPPGPVVATAPVTATAVCIVVTIASSQAFSASFSAM